MLLRGQRSIVRTDHKKLKRTGTTHENARTLRQRACAEELALIIKHTKRGNSDVAGTSSRIPQNKEAMALEEILPAAEEHSASK